MKITDLPSPVKELAEKRRAEQPQFCPADCDRNDLGYAFSWQDTAEGKEFWKSIDKSRNSLVILSIYHSKYPEETFTRGEEVEVRDDETDEWEPAKYVGKVDHDFAHIVIWKKGTIPFGFKYCRKVPQKVRLSKLQAAQIVAEKMGIDINSLEII
jgi:hypothetical protein